MLTVVIARTRLFAREYQDWHARPIAQKTLNATFTWWTEKVRIMRKYNRVAGNMGRGKEYGMNTETSVDSNKVLKNCALSMQLSTQNTQLQQQLQHQ